MIPHPETWELISSRVEALERRVAALEHGSLPSTEPEAPTALPAAAPRVEGAGSWQIGGVLNTFGKALLGIAGAYLLRAISGSGVVPRGIVAGIAIVYAVLWLVTAARVVSRCPLGGVLYATTSALILAPMLWEMSLRFKVLPAWGCALVLAGYVAAATALAHQPGRSAVFTVAYAGSALTALALLLGTHDMAPFAAILLAMSVVCEFANVRGRAPAIRPVVGLAADVAIWILLFIYHTPPETRTDYPALSAGAVLAAATVLFLIQGASIAWQVVAMGKAISLFEAAQAMIALLLAACAIVWFLPLHSGIVLGALFLVLAGICYGLAFSRFRGEESQRNFRVFTVWSAALLMSAVYLVLTAQVASAVLGISAMFSILLADRLRSSALELHGVTYLGVAAIASGLLQFVFGALAGAVPETPSWPLITVAGCALLAYAASDEAPEERISKQLLHLVPALVAACALAALLSWGLVRLMALTVASDVFRVALVRTVTICLIAVGLAFGGSRLRRTQMVRVAYAATAFVAAKLLFEDLRHGRLEFIAGSICLVALTLIAVPRLARRGRMGSDVQQAD